MTCTLDVHHAGMSSALRRAISAGSASAAWDTRWPSVSRTRDSTSRCGIARAQAEPRAAFGAHVVDELTDLTACDIVFTMVSTGTDVKEVLVGTHCVTSTGKAPQIVVDSTSMALAESRGGHP